MSTFWVLFAKALIVGFMGWAKARKARMDAEALLAGTLSGEDAAEEPRWGGELVSEKPKLPRYVGTFEDERS